MKNVCLYNLFIERTFFVLRVDIMRIQETMTVYDTLNILSDAAKYDVACTSSGVDRSNDGTGMGNCKACGICHSFSADGRCISLLKILFTNECINIALTAGAMMW